MQMGTIVRVFIASPGDVERERDAAVRVVQKWNAARSVDSAAIIEAVRNDTHAYPAMGAHPQTIINGQLLGRCDLLIGIFWSKLGTPTDTDPSGTLQEIREFGEKHGHDNVMLFFSKASLPNDLNTSQLEAVRDFRKSVQSAGLFVEYADAADFEAKLREMLDQRMGELLKGYRGKVIAETSAPSGDRVEALRAHLNRIIDHCRNRIDDCIPNGVRESCMLAEAANERLKSMAASPPAVESGCRAFLEEAAANLEGLTRGPGLAGLDAHWRDWRIVLNALEDRAGML